MYFRPPSIALSESGKLLNAAPAPHSGNRACSVIVSGFS
jgi:hypothetical protein